ncbi:MAG: DEAD/DEAH box helicase [candidate division Zixibacteria bacterium]|nr:DEAD/DEAH box helicase [candidate division Zixibacteria bacterium]
MHVSRLSKIGIPQILIDCWKREQGEMLLPLQSQMVSHYSDLMNQSLVISAPTSSGKTFCAEIIAVTKLLKGKKVIYTVPLKAIAEEKYIDFKEKYSNLGIKVIISTKDRREYDGDLERGQFDLAILIYEKLNQLLIKNIDILGSIDLVVIDELQMIGSDSRGAVLELALVKILASQYKPQLLALSAVLKDSNSLCSWLGAKLVLDRNRPVELRQGIFLKGEFLYREYNSGREGKENLVDLESQDMEELLLANVEELVKRGEQVLVFLKSKQESEVLAFLLAERIKVDLAWQAIEELENLEQTTLRDKLITCLRSGVAFHNADLCFEERKIVERFYLKGEIRVIFSTTTLAMGVNLPAKTVFIEAQKYKAGHYSNHLVMYPLEWNEYENMSGRAGRFGLENDFGRSILVAANRFHFESLWEQYIEEKEERISSQLKNKAIEDIILDLVCAGLVKDIPQLERCLNHTLDCKCGNAPSDLNQTLQNLVDRQIIILDSKGRFLPSELARACVLKGASLETALVLSEKLKSKPKLDRMTWLNNIMLTKDADDIYITLSFQEQKNYQRVLVDKCKEGEIRDEELVNLVRRDSVLTQQEMERIKLILLLEDWVKPISTVELEQKYLCRSGQISQIAQQASWLLDIAASVAEATKSDTEMVKFLNSLSSEINFGLDQRGIGLAKLRIEGLGRDHIWKLVENGIDSLDKLKEMEEESLAKFLPTKLVKKIKDGISQLELKEGKSKKEKTRLDTTKKRPTKLKLDGLPYRDNFLIYLDQKRIPLSAKSFKYLVKLVWGIFKREGGWVHKFEFEPGINQAKYIYRLRNELKQDKIDELIENNRLGYYRLNVRPNEIEIDKSRLLQNADAEVKKWAGEL